MITGTPKPIEEILEMVESYDNGNYNSLQEFNF